MNFVFNINIPANTPESDPVVQDLNLHAGIIYSFQLLSSPGVNGLVYCYLTDIFGNMVYPRNPFPEGVYKLRGYLIEGRYPACKYDLRGTKSTLRFVGYSPGTDYDHVITTSFWIVRGEDIPFLEKASKEEISGFLSGMKEEIKNV